MEITDEKLLRIALITALIGIIGLIIFTPSVEVKKISINDITRSMIDEKVSIQGVITNIAQSSSKTSYFLTISDGETQITLIIFEKQAAEISSRNLDIEDFKNRKVEVIGTITEYKSDLELILSSGDSLRIIN
ncbi:exodeoxyribonuclease VII large subunit [Methanobrevibacter sp.]|uniref:exodeoxyribonuclease VII large subunit n=1 Tax=Methanobrevibacter sp. TaxID=66852 RepID=UPI003D7DAB86